MGGGGLETIITHHLDLFIVKNIVDISFYFIFKENLERKIILIPRLGGRELILEDWFHRFQDLIYINDFKKKIWGGQSPLWPQRGSTTSRITDCFVFEEKNSSKTSEMKIYV